MVFFLPEKLDRFRLVMICGGFMVFLDKNKFFTFIFLIILLN
jgi:hypothetical protein